MSANYDDNRRYRVYSVLDCYYYELGEVLGAVQVNLLPAEHLLFCKQF